MRPTTICEFGRVSLPGAEARKAWVNEQYIQISESITGRAIRTPSGPTESPT